MTTEPSLERLFAKLEMLRILRTEGARNGTKYRVTYLEFGKVDHYQIEGHDLSDALAEVQRRVGG
jgi:hypothetical protein